MLITTEIDQSHILRNITLKKEDPFEAIEPHKSFNTCWGALHSWDFADLTENEILDMCPIEIINVERPIPNRPLLFLEFDRESLHNTSIQLDGINIPIKPRKPQPMQCKKCYTFGHTKKRCRAPEQLCRKCSKTESTHNLENCQGEDRCINCNQNHIATDKKCPSYLYQQNILMMAETEKIDLTEARSRLPPKQTYAQATTTNQPQPDKRKKQNRHYPELQKYPTPCLPNAETQIVSSPTYQNKTHPEEKTNPMTTIMSPTTGQETETETTNQKTLNENKTTPDFLRNTKTKNSEQKDKGVKNRRPQETHNQNSQTPKKASHKSGPEDQKRQRTETICETPQNTEMHLVCTECTTTYLKPECLEKHRKFNHDGKPLNEKCPKYKNTRLLREHRCERDYECSTLYQYENPTTGRAIYVDNRGLRYNDVKNFRLSFPRHTIPETTEEIGGRRHYCQGCTNLEFFGEDCLDAHIKFYHTGLNFQKGVRPREHRCDLDLKGRKRGECENLIEVMNLSGTNYLNSEGKEYRSIEDFRSYKTKSEKRTQVAFSIENTEEHESKSKKNKLIQPEPQGNSSPRTRNHNHLSKSSVDVSKMVVNFEKLQQIEDQDDSFFTSTQESTNLISQEFRSQNTVADICEEEMEDDSE